MSRARNIKPGFFRNDLLAECDPLARILFAALWCEADRSGRLEDRPKRIKAECLPYDDCDIEELLSQLEERGFITRYSHGAGQYIAIPNFGKHQNPHKNETASTIPAPGEKGAGMVPAPDKHGASTVQEPEGHSSNRADSLLLIPDSLQEHEPAIAGLPPASASPPPANPEPDDDNGEQPRPPQGEQGRPPCPHERIVALYHEVLPELRQVREWNETRRRLLGRRWSEHPARQSLDWWRKFFEYVRQSRFLMGQTTGRDGRPFDCDLEWLIRPANFAKVVEGKYEDAAA